MAKEGTLLIVDDNRSILAALRLLLEKYFARVLTLPTPNRLATTLREEQIDVILLDMNFTAGINTGNEGIYWLSEIHARRPDIKVVLFTAYADIDLAVRAMRDGAVDFVVKPWDNDRLVASLRNAYNLARSAREVKQLKEIKRELKQEEPMFWGGSPAMARIREIVEKVAATDANILITGENGTGKEMLAREIHNRSARSGELMVSVDMGAVPETLFESELFGHVRGAFTDARADRAGKFEVADHGTLFLDEIGEMPVELQAKLLRVLECGEFIKIGETRPTKVDLRIIAATNRDLEKEIVSEGYSGEMIRKMDEKPVNFFASRRIGKYSNSLEVNVAEKTFAMLRDKAANGESFLIIGRCSDQVLKGNPNMLSIFICGNQQAKVGRVMEKKGLSAEDAIEEIKEVDRSRKSYHNYYCETKWGDARGYDMTVKSDVLGFEGTAKMLIAYIRSFMEQD